MFLFLGLFVTAQAEIYFCESPAGEFEAVVDYELPEANLEYVSITYNGRKILPKNIFPAKNIFADFAYGNDELSLGVSVKDEPYGFYLNARRAKDPPDPKRFSGTVLITNQDRFQLLPLECLTR